ncbi:uncharacterized protein LOC143252222 [Tachypleus tridentatus]|uniref:uncharacterized protein LOC143252222 n=1 Tax=Tachypleus tridentatus TaxID=6853 RepID=UPI003FD46FF9
MSMLRLALVACALVAVSGAPQLGNPGHPKINWGKCKQLEPSNKEKETKQKVINDCLKQNPPPNSENTPQEVLDQHRSDITTCALKAEGWFNKNGKYKFNRAVAEIEEKGLNAEILENIKAKHGECKSKSEEKFPEDFVGQVQLYQACMDLEISTICGIVIVPPESD